MGNGGINGLLKKEFPSLPGAPRAPGREGIDKREGGFWLR
jgi:hypothetical protein